MFGVRNIMIFFAIVISCILYWAASNVCKYNFAIEKRTKLLNIVTESIDPSLGNAQYYFYEESVCPSVAALHSSEISSSDTHRHLRRGKEVQDRGVQPSLNRHRWPHSTPPPPNRPAAAARHGTRTMPLSCRCIRLWRIGVTDAPHMW